MSEGTSPNRYLVTPMECKSCAARVQTQRAFQKAGGDPAGLQWPITDREV